MCVVGVKYSRLLVVDMAGVACRGLWCAIRAIDPQYACMHIASYSADRIR